MQIICTSLQSDNHGSTSPLEFLQAGCPSCCPTNSVKALTVRRSLAVEKRREQLPKSPTVTVKPASTSWTSDQSTTQRWFRDISVTSASQSNMTTSNLTHSFSTTEMHCNTHHILVAVFPIHMGVPADPQQISIGRDVFNNNNNQRQCLCCYPHDHGHCESSRGSSDECRLSAGWPPTLRPSQPTWAVSPLINGCYYPHPPSPLVIMSFLVMWAI